MSLAPAAGPVPGAAADGRVVGATAPARSSAPLGGGPGDAADGPGALAGSVTSVRPGGPPVASGVRSSGEASPVRPRWRWPLAPRPSVARSFVAPRTRYGAGHRGLDLRSPVGATVRAVEGGVVTHVGVLAGRGTVTVRHADGLRSTYEPVVGTVGHGETVVAGQPLGTVGVGTSSHCAPDSCLHLGAVRGRDYLDPYPLLAGGRVRLLPLTAR
ncbi:M23 family metallopeptidase [Phycicoccus sp. CSK15P-2]|nr:M23 family metallopeptidase [Phycicoccus sp. CSK15P-2]